MEDDELMELRVTYIGGKGKGKKNKPHNKGKKNPPKVEPQPEHYDLPSEDDPDRDDARVDYVPKK